jgi:phosphoribosylformimino-5-aminoimidazole carboxamide ribotide isomerase
MIRELVAATGVPVIASGGVSEARHIDELRAIGAEGAIVGRALYDGRLRYADALEAARSEVAPC